MRTRLAYGFCILYAICIYGPMAAMSIGAGLIMAGWIALRWGFLRADLGRFWGSPLFTPTIVLGTACLWSLVWAQITGHTFYGMKPEIHWLHDSAKVWHLFFPFILASLFAVMPERELVKVYKFWLAMGALSGLLGIVQHYIPLYHAMEVPDDGLRGYYHATGMTGFHLSYASIMAFPFGAWLGIVAIHYRSGGFKKNTAVAAAAVALIFTAHIFTYSRITWVAAPATVILMALLGLRGWARRCLIALIIVFGLVWGSSSEVRLRFKGLNSMNERVEIWGANAEMIKAFPAFGVGWHHNSDLSKAYYDAKGTTGFQSHAHNSVIDQWASTGSFGLIGFLWWCIASVVIGWTLYRKAADPLWQSLGLGLIAGWFCFHVNGITQTNFWDAKVMHQLGWITALTIEVYRRHLIRT